MYGWMDGWMHGCMHVCMYGPVSRVPESVSLGDHTMGGGRDPESGLIYIYIYTHTHYTSQYGSLLSWMLFAVSISSLYSVDIQCRGTSQSTCRDTLGLLEGCSPITSNARSPEHSIGKTTLIAIRHFLSLPCRRSWTMWNTNSVSYGKQKITTINPSTFFAG